MTDTAVRDRIDLMRELEEQVGVLIRRVRRVIAVRAHQVHPELQPSSYLMLGWLRTHGPVRASEMADAFGIDKGAISRQVQHLVDIELVDRTPDPEDRRAHLVEVTEDGVRRLDEVTEARRAFLDERLGDLADGDLADFVRLLSRYNEALEGGS